MADEAASAAKSGNTVQCFEHDIVNFGKILNESSIYAGKEVDKNPESGKVISAAREVARRRVESASAATKRAENLDSIVKAAELAAAAVAQAGTIIAMGDPLPFKSLLALVSNLISKFRGKDTQKATEDGRSSSLNENHEQYEESTQGNCPNTGHGSGHWISCLSIQKGSKVEVMSDDDGLKGAWFSAMVHDIKGNKAYVCFDDVSNNLGQLMEWIDLESDEQKAPRIRAVRSATSLKHEGTRKRSREQRGSYIWNVGDHVDAWIHDRWWEAIVFEKNLGDETMLTVHIPVRSDKKVVHSTYLRPSLIWKDGQWVEWSHPDGKPLHLHEGDTPQEKRQRLGRLEAVSHLKHPDNLRVHQELTGKEKRALKSYLKMLLLLRILRVFGVELNLRRTVPLIGTSVRELRHVHPQTNAHGVSGNGNGNGVEKRNTPKFGPCSDHAEQTNVPLSETESCVEAEPSVPISKKKYAPISGTNLVAKTKSTVDRPSKDEDKSSENPGKVACSVIKQPCRSNRRIQPTSRLLEGLESSLPVSKILSISYERKPHRGGSSSRVLPSCGGCRLRQMQECGYSMNSSSCSHLFRLSHEIPLV
ncbi:hypothetical protein HPP92_022109 [Vanilla planifolia]|uniref:Agenet domain-containing protein n=1 Tax=Vanilla planifolia TaxID=51239 RepID=A0A835UGX6_VANPL|nr:hypothetical protein HPP92_022109 [Vanilla planifolia]